MQVPTTWQGIPGQPQIPAQQMAAPSAALQQPGLVFPIQQYQVNNLLNIKLHAELTAWHVMRTVMKGWLKHDRIFLLHKCLIDALAKCRLWSLRFKCV